MVEEAIGIAIRVMKFRGLLIAVVLLGLLSGALYWSSHRKASGAGAGQAPVSTSAIPAFDQPGITQLTVTVKGAAPIVLLRDAGGKWRIQEPRALNADQDAVADLLSTLGGLNVDRVIEEKGANLAQYGLDQPAVEVDFAGGGSAPRRLLIGDDTPAGGDAYAMLGGAPRVFTVAIYAKTGVNKSLNDLRDKRLLTMDPDKVSRVEVLKKPQDLEFARIKSGWQILKPSPLRADSSAIDDFVRTLAQSRMVAPELGAPAAETEFARGKPVAEARLTGDAGVQTLEVRKNNRSYYAKSDVTGDACKVDTVLGQALEKNLDDFRNRKLFDFGDGQLSRVEMRSGANDWVFTRSGSDWQSNGKKMDLSQTQGLVDQLRDLSATKFVNAGFGRPEIQITATPQSGGQIESVAIAKSGGGYVAKRESDPTLYQLDPSAVTDLTTAAAAIKPAAVSAKSPAAK